MGNKTSGKSIKMVYFDRLTVIKLKLTYSHAIRAIFTHPQTVDKCVSSSSSLILEIISLSGLPNMDVGSDTDVVLSLKVIRPKNPNLPTVSNKSNRIEVSDVQRTVPHNDCNEPVLHAYRALTPLSPSNPFLLTDLLRIKVYDDDVSGVEFIDCIEIPLSELTHPNVIEKQFTVKGCTATIKLRRLFVPEPLPPGTQLPDSQKDFFHPSHELIVYPPVPDRKELFVVRHGESQWNVAEAKKDVVALARSRNPGLTIMGMKQAKDLNQYLQQHSASAAAQPPATSQAPEEAVERKDIQVEEKEIASETPTTSPAVPEERPAQETPSEETPAKETPAKETPAVEKPEEAKSVEGESAVAAETPAAAAETPAAETPAAAAETPAASEETPAVAAKTPAASAETPAAAAETPAAAAETPAAAAETPAAAAETPATASVAETPAGTSSEAKTEELEDGVTKVEDSETSTVTLTDKDGVIVRFSTKEYIDYQRAPEEGKTLQEFKSKEERQDYIARCFFKSTGAFSSPLCRAIQTALLVLQDTPVLKSSKLRLMTTIRERKNLTGLDTLGEGTDAGLLLSIPRKLKEVIESTPDVTPQDKETIAFATKAFNDAFSNATIDRGDAVGGWWSSVRDSDKLIIDRAYDMLCTARYSGASYPVFVGHSLFFKKLCGWAVADAKTFNKGLPPGDDLPTHDQMKDRRLNNGSMLYLDVHFTNEGPKIHFASLVGPSSFHPKH